MSRIWLLSGAFLGLSVVALGAFGAHSLKDILNDYSKEIYFKAVLYQMFHCMALFVTGILQTLHPNLNLNPSGWAFIIGILLFSGSLYVLAITNIKSMGMITPIGGLSFLFGWGWMIYTLVKIEN